MDFIFIVFSFFVLIYLLIGYLNADPLLIGCFEFNGFLRQVFSHCLPKRRRKKLHRFGEKENIYKALTLLLSYIIGRDNERNSDKSVF